MEMSLTKIMTAQPVSKQSLQPFRASTNRMWGRPGTVTGVERFSVLDLQEWYFISCSAVICQTVIMETQSINTRVKKM